MSNERKTRVHFGDSGGTTLSDIVCWHGKMRGEESTLKLWLQGGHTQEYHGERAEKIVRQIQTVGLNLGDITDELVRPRLIQVEFHSETLSESLAACLASLGQLTELQHSHFQLSINADDWSSVKKMLEEESQVTRYALIWEKKHDI